MVDVREVAPHEPDVFAAWHAALVEAVTDGREAPVVWSLPELVSSLGSPSPLKRRVAVGAWEGEACVGAMLLEWPLTADLETAGVEIGVPPRHRRRGVGDALWRHALAATAAEGRTVLQAELAVPGPGGPESTEGGRFALARGFVPAHVEDHLVADLPFDAGVLADVAVGPTHGYRVVAWTGPGPESLLEARARLRSAMSADVPTGALTRTAVTVTAEEVRRSDERQARDHVVLHALALDGADEPVGYSTLFVPYARPADVQQDDTLVLVEHRGHGLGARLKAANLRSLASLPAEVGAGRRWIHTWTASDNAAMQAVNARFGFRRVEVVHELERGCDA